MTDTSKYTITNFEDACDYVFEIIPEFEKAMGLVNKIIDNPTEYSGQQAAMSAVKLSFYRFKFGVMAQHWKLQSAQTKRLSDRLIKDALMSAYDGLLECINTLKIVARAEHDIAKGQ